MTDKITQKADIELAVKKAKRDLDCVEHIQPDLLQTKVIEIAAIRAAIKEKQVDHADGKSYIATREQYVAIVQPLKNELCGLIAENEARKIENNSKTQAANAAYLEERAPYEVVLSEKKAEFDAFVEATEIPLIIPENPTYAIIEEFSPSEEKPLKVIRTILGIEYHMWCYVTQDIKDAHVAGDLKIGDVVIVTFVDRDITKPLAQQKVFKSW